MPDNFHEKEIVIKPPSSAGYFNVREIYQYRHMLWSMVWREIRVQFDDLYLGFFWASARPLVMLLVFACIKHLSRANLYETISYSLYFYSGIILWFYFVEATNATTRSIARDAGLIKKVYFPRLISPLVRILSNLYTLILASIPLIIMMAWQGVCPGWKLLMLPLVLGECMILCLGIGVLFASLSLTNKDAERFLKIMLYVGLYVSPVIYAPDMIPEAVRSAYFLNPMAGTLLAFRACLFDSFPFPWVQFGSSCLISFFIVVFGIALFRRAEIYFADKL